MPPIVAAALFAVGILGLFYLDYDPKVRTSPVLWVAAIWVFVGASRMFSQWFSTGIPLVGDPYLEGSPIDRAIITGLLVIALVTLVLRAREVTALFAANPWIFLFLLYCLVSVFWSDFPFVSFKRWTKFLGNVAIVLLVLTEANPPAALKRLFNRTGFFLIPLSLLFIKYYPSLGRYYSASWVTGHKGVATDKNGLGTICMLWGLVSVWRFREAYRAPKSSSRTKTLLAHGTILAMIVWLLYYANSQTALACLALGTALILMTARPRRNRPATVHRFAGACVAIALFLYVFQDVWAAVVHLFGRKPDLTGRTDIWNDVLQLHVNPFIGTGFESFWLGPRLDFFWKKYAFHINEAHNGYLETYLTLGWIGVALLVLMIVLGYRNAIAALRQDRPWSVVYVSFVIVTIIYNLTEASFKAMHPLFICFLLAAMAIPKSLQSAEMPATNAELPVVSAVESPPRPQEHEHSMTQWGD